jgi:hypothetical protein
MYTNLVLKERNDEFVIYGYSVDRLGFPSDGEIQYFLKTGERKLLKTATGDDDGGHARWFVFQFMRRVVNDYGCPEKRCIATG